MVKRFTLAARNVRVPRLAFVFLFFWRRGLVAYDLEVDLSSRKYFYKISGRRMSLTLSFKRRSSLAICIAILKAAKKGIKKTHLLCSASLSYEQMIRYIEFLEAHGLIEEYDNSYHTTSKGLKLTEEYESSSLIRGVTLA